MGYYTNPILWALAISLSTLAGVWTYVAFTRRGLAAGLRGVALIILPFAALFTRTLTLLMKILDAVTLWATGLVFSPMVWFGLVLFLVAVALFFVARALPSGKKAAKEALPTARPGSRPGSRPGAGTDPEMDEIEAILRKRGIS